MNMKKILAMMAVATVLSSGVAPGVTAHAAQNSNGTYELEDFEDGTTAAMPDAEGEILINGEFNRTSNPIPTPDQDGRYLHVTMPIALNFTYDVDNDQMVSADAPIVNQSQHVEKAKDPNPIITPAEVEMKFVSLNDHTSGADNSKMEFVDSITNSNVKNKVLLPFKLSLLDKNGAIFQEHNLKEIKDNVQNIQEVTIPAKGAIGLKLGKIAGQDLGNKDLISQGTMTTKHSLTLRFEYKGK